MGYFPPGALKAARRLPSGAMTAGFAGMNAAGLYDSGNRAMEVATDPYATTQEKMEYGAQPALDAAWLATFAPKVGGRVLPWAAGASAVNDLYYANQAANDPYAAPGEAASYGVDAALSGMMAIPGGQIPAFAGMLAKPGIDYGINAGITEPSQWAQESTENFNKMGIHGFGDPNSHYRPKPDNPIPEGALGMLANQYIPSWMRWRGNANYANTPRQPQMQPPTPQQQQAAMPIMPILQFPANTPMGASTLPWNPQAAQAGSAPALPTLRLAGASPNRQQPTSPQTKSAQPSAPGPSIASALAANVFGGVPAAPSPPPEPMPWSPPPAPAPSMTASSSRNTMDTMPGTAARIAQQVGTSPERQAHLDAMQRAGQGIYDPTNLQGPLTAAQAGASGETGPNDYDPLMNPMVIPGGDWVAKAAAKQAATAQRQKEIDAFPSYAEWDKQRTPADKARANSPALAQAGAMRRMGIQGALPVGSTLPWSPQATLDADPGQADRLARHNDYLKGNTPDQQLRNAMFVAKGQGQPITPAMAQVVTGQRNDAAGLAAAGLDPRYGTDVQKTQLDAALGRQQTELLAEVLKNIPVKDWHAAQQALGLGAANTPPTTPPAEEEGGFWNAAMPWMKVAGIGGLGYGALRALPPVIRGVKNAIRGTGEELGVVKKKPAPKATPKAAEKGEAGKGKAAPAAKTTPKSNPKADEVRKAFDAKVQERKAAEKRGDNATANKLREEEKALLRRYNRTRGYRGSRAPNGKNLGLIERFKKIFRK